MSLKALYEEQGYVVVQDLIDNRDYPFLQQACDRVISRTREGNWPHRRTVGKQFPPYGDENPDSWGVQHLMHPDLGEPVFAKWYTSDKLLRVATELLDCDVGELQMELFNLLINPLRSDFALRWHRDDIREDASEEEERKSLEKWQYGVQWNTALYTDTCLYVVPGSQKVPRTPAQRELSAGQVLSDPLAMPGSKRLILRPGETVFYNSNILHCATYNSKERRATLHGCIGNALGGSSRARNILQHGLEWMKSTEFRSGLPNDRAKQMLDKLILMYQATGNIPVEYSLEG